TRFSRDWSSDVCSSDLGSQEMPFRRGLSALGEDVVYDSGDYAGLLDKACAAFGWDAAKEEVSARRERGELVGLGLAAFVEKSGRSEERRVGEGWQGGSG